MSGICPIGWRRRAPRSPSRGCVAEDALCVLLTEITIEGSSGAVCHAVRCYLARAVRLILFSLLAATNSVIDAAESGSAAHSVLLLGGRSTMGSAELTSGDFYDASTQTLTAAPTSLPIGSATPRPLLDDGRILILRRAHGNLRASI